MKKNLIIIGASGDLGKGAGDVLIRKGYDKYFFLDRKFEDKTDTANNIQYIRTDDMTNEENVINAFKKIEQNKTELYFLFSTIGGFYGGKSLEETPFENWLKMQNINLNTAFLIAKHFAIFVKETAGGSICFTGAVSGNKHEKNKIAYGASKKGLHYLTKSLVLESKTSGFSVNTIAPLIIDTPANREWVENKDMMVSPGDIGEFIHALFLNYKIVNGNVIELPGTLNNR